MCKNIFALCVIIVYIISIPLTTEDGMGVRIEYTVNGEKKLSGLIKKAQAEKTLKAYKSMYGNDCRIIDNGEKY